VAKPTDYFDVRWEVLTVVRCAVHVEAGESVAEALDMRVLSRALAHDHPVNGNVILVAEGVRSIAVAAMAQGDAEAGRIVKRSVGRPRGIGRLVGV
jgi:hypothetical protein